MMAEPKSLLVVEDDPIVREGLALVLRREGYEVRLAANGEEALACLSAGPRPDLIILDMLMPVLDGWHFLQQLHGGKAPPVPIVVVTSAPLTLEWAQDHRCCGFVRKPFDLDDMVAEVRRCLAEYRS
jgi:CheY-like chemotaxis protein